MWRWRRAWWVARVMTPHGRSDPSRALALVLNEAAVWPSTKHDSLEAWATICRDLPGQSWMVLLEMRLGLGQWTEQGGDVGVTECGEDLVGAFLSGGVEVLERADL